MKPLCLAVMLFTVSACSQIREQIVTIAGNDLQRTSEIAAKYGKPEVKQCADFLVASIGKLNAEDADLQALLAEDTEGLFSAALKAVLVKEHIAALNDPARADAFRKEFDVACRAVAGTIVLNVARDAAKAAKNIK